jgi:hypothetical protein
MSTKMALQEPNTFLNFLPRIFRDHSCFSLNKVEFKTKLGEIIVEHLRPIRQEVERLLNDKGHLDNLLTEGNEKAAVISENTWKEVQKCIGFL